MFTTQRLKRVLDKVTMLQSRSLYGHCQMPARIASGLSTRILHILIGLAGTVHSLHRWMCDRCLVWTNVGTYPLRIAMGKTWSYAAKSCVLVWKRRRPHHVD